MSAVRFDYRDERVVVTGAAGLIGRALVHRFADAGAGVLAVDVDADGLKVFDAVPRVATMTGDLAREDAADAVFDRLAATGGGLDVLVNNAAMTEVRTPFIDIGAALWEAVIGANLRSAYLLSVRAVRHWRDAGRGGAIVSMSSPGGSRAHDDQSAYDVTKAGIEALSRAIAVELGGLGVRANCIAPASVVGTARPATDLPSGRTTSPEEVADAALYLASPAAAQLNGHVLHLDGGLHARLRTDPSQDQGRTR
jgi:3-oxoacyl-[acyl-carrier protein] reductase